MRLVILAIILLASINGESTALRSLTTSANELPRLLRSHTIMTTEREERAGGVVEKVSTVIKSTAAKLEQTKELKGYLKQQQSADEVFGLLKLTDKTDNILANPKIKAWAKYIKMFNEKNPKDQVQMIDLLTARLGEDVASRMIEAAKSLPSSKKLADKLQTDQFRGWIDRETTPGALLKILKLDDSANIGNANFQALEKYVGVYNHRFKTKQLDFLEVFRRAYGGEKKLAKALIALPDTNANAKELQRVLFTKWSKEWTRNSFLRNVLKRNEHNWFNHPYANVFIHYSNFLTDQRKVRNALQ
ncbi:hypothetical protein V7S43_011142 [Phytophthora oleae]|uniref:RxLR effector protein n=1 Tax=Phytophthora oleae TaxID=2107226 RepID=A0ABD3FCS2_9STRA